MGHAITFMEYKPLKNGKAPVEAMLADARDFAFECVDPMENEERSYHGSFRRKSNGVASSREEAEEILNSGFYDDGYVLYKRYRKTAKNKEAEQRAYDLRSELRTLDRSSKVEFSAKKTKTCKECGKRVNVQQLPIISKTRCPYCGNDMRSQTVLKKIHSLERKITEADQRAEPTSGKYDLMYLAKFEVHC